MDRKETIARIKKALQSRSGKTWSVTGGRGTSWGWINISAPPKRLMDDGEMSLNDCLELAEDVAETMAAEDVQAIVAEVRQRYPQLRPVQQAAQVTRLAKKRHPR